MKWCSASRIMSEMQIGTTKSYHPLGWLLSKRQKITSISEDVEKMEHLYTVDGRVNWRVIVELLRFPRNLKIEPPYCSAISLLEIYIKRKQNQYLEDIFALPPLLQHHSP